MLTNWGSYCVLKKQEMYVVLESKLESSLSNLYTNIGDDRADKLQNLKVSLLADSMLIKDSMVASKVNYSGFRASNFGSQIGMLRSTLTKNAMSSMGR